MPSYASLTYDQLWSVIFKNPLDGSEADYVVNRVRSLRDSAGLFKPDLDEPLTYDKIREYVANKKGDFNEKASLASIYRDGLSSGSLPSLVPDANTAVANATLPGGWVERLIRAAIDTITSPETWRALSEVNLTNWTNWDAADYDRAKKAFLAFVQNPSGPVQLFINTNAAVIPYLVTFMTGLSVNSNVIKEMLDGSIDAGDRLDMGKVVYSLLDTNLLEDKVKQGYLDRNPGDGEVENMQRLFGALLRLELGGVAVEAISPLIPKQVAVFLKSIREAMENALNLDDAAEEIFQIPIDNLVSKGLEAKFNRTFKPVDLTDNEARQALISERIDKETYEKILNNSGLRDNVRDILLDFTAANLTESDINEAYQRNLLSIEEVKDQYKQKYFQEPERQIKTDLVKGTRRWTLQTKVVELLGNLYRDGVQTKDACTPYLNALGYENDEQELWFLMQELEQQQRKWITDRQLYDLLEDGQVTMTFAHDYLVKQGMMSDDAWITLSNHLMKVAKTKLPKAAKDKCAGVLDPEKVLVTVLGEIAKLANFGTLFNGPMQTLLKCLLEELEKTTSTP